MSRKIIPILMLAALWAGPSMAGEPMELPLVSALATGITRNLDLKATRVNVPVRSQDVTVGESVFDPTFSAQVYGTEVKNLTGGILTGMEYERNGSLGVQAGVSKRFELGTESSVSLETGRTTDNSLVDALDPNYKSRFVLNLTQPLLRDFGREVNTANVRISENRVKEASYGVLDAAQRVGLAIENAYWSLSAAQAVVRLREESMDLARELTAYNEKRLAKGMITITEKAESESAAAAREEQVIAARQQAEVVMNNLKDLLEIRMGDELFGKTLLAAPLPPPEEDAPSPADAVGAAMENRPDLMARRLAVSDQDIRLSYLRNQKHPRIDLVLTLGANGLSGRDRPANLFGPSIHSPLVGEYSDSWTTMADVDGYEWKAGLRYSQPIGNRAAKARARQAEWEKAQVVYSAKRLEGTVETEVQNALVDVVRGRERVAVSESSVRLAEETLAQEMRRLSAGLSDSFHVLRFQDDLVAARVRRVQALADYNRGLAALYRAMGENLTRRGITAEDQEGNEMASAR